MESTLLKPLLIKLEACSEARDWSEPYPTLIEAWRACHRPEWMVWLLNRLGYQDEATIRLYACRMVRETPLYTIVDGQAVATERHVWDLLTDERSRTAVEVAERFARGEATREELAAAWDAAWDAAWAAAWDAARAAAWAAARAAAWAAAWDAASSWQADALRAVISEDNLIELANRVVPAEETVRA